MIGTNTETSNDHHQRIQQHRSDKRQQLYYFHKHRKARKQGEESAIITMPTPVYASKVMLVCPKCGKPTRVGHAIVGDKKMRACKKCGAQF